MNSKLLLLNASSKGLFRILLVLRYNLIYRKNNLLCIEFPDNG